MIRWGLVAKTVIRETLGLLLSASLSSIKPPQFKISGHITAFQREVTSCISTSLRHQPKCKQLFLFSGDNVNCQLITWNCCKQWKFHWNNALNVPGLWLVYCILKDKQPGWMCTKAAGSENIVWSEWLRHTRCCRVPERVIEDLFVQNRSSLHSAWQKHRVQTQLDEMRPRQKIRGASKVIVSQ